MLFFCQAMISTHVQYVTFLLNYQFWFLCSKFSVSFVFRSSLSWDVTDPYLVLTCRRFWTVCLSHLQGWSSTLEDGKEFLSELLLVHTPQHYSMMCVIPFVYRGVKTVPLIQEYESILLSSSFISFNILSDDRSKTSSKTIPPHSAI